MRYFMFFLVALFLHSCASINITSVPKSHPERPFSRIAIVCIETSNDMKLLDASYFDANVRGNFNDVDNLKFRAQLERTVARNLGTNGYPQIIKSSEIFKVDEDYSFEQFYSEIEKTGAEAVLFINLRDYWMSTKYVTSHYENMSVTRDESEPNSSYYAYLYPVNDFQKYIWVGKINVSGIWAGYDTLNNYLARGIARMLSKEKYIY